VAQDLDRNLYIGLLYFVVNGLQDAREVTPIVDFSNHPLTWDCVFKAIKQLGNILLPEVYIVLERAQIFR
jgi:hypothetical protein